MQKKRKGGRRSNGSGCIYKDGKGWKAVFPIGKREDGRRILKSSRWRSYSDAEEWLKLIALEYPGGRLGPSVEMTLGDWLDQWLKSIKGNVAPKTHAFYTGLCEQHIKPELGVHDLKGLSVEAIQALLNRKTQQGLSASTVSGIRATLRRALNIAMRRSMVSRNVASLAEGPKVVRPEPEFLDEKDCGVFVKSLGRGPDANLFRLILATGMRIGEATGLRWEDVDFDQGAIRLRVQLQRLEKKLQHVPLKSKTSRRMLPMLDLAREALKDEQARQQIDGCANPLGLALLNEFGRPWDQKTANDKLKAALKAAKLKEMSVHKLRHTTATLWLASGVDLATVRDLLGHSTIKLLDIYGHSLPASHVEAGKKLEKALKTGKVGDAT